MICEPELLFLQDPSGLIERFTLFNTEEYEQKTLCMALNSGLHARNNEKNCKIKDVLKGYNKEIIPEIEEAIQKKYNFPLNGK